MLISELRETTRQGFLDFAWRQWAQAGLSANVTGLDDWAIDPEALILFTIAVARRDPRLFDEMLDWLAVNHRLLSMQRMKNLSSRFLVDARLVSAVVASAQEPSAARRLQGQRVTNRAPATVPVFSSDVLSFIGDPDATFAEYGYLRPRTTRSGKSRAPDVGIPANFAFQLRHLLGPGSRSEVMRVLLTLRDGMLDAARISDECGFAKRNVNDTLSSLVASRVIKARWSGNERHFIAYRDKWATLLEVGPSGQQIPLFVSWVHLLPAALGILTWLEAEAAAPDSDYLISSRARSLTQHVTRDLGVAGIDVSTKQPAPGTAYLPVFAEVVRSVLETMRVGQ